MAPKELTSVQLRKLRLNQVSFYLELFIQLFLSKTNMKTLVSIAELQSLLEKLQAAVKKLHGYSQTERLQAADKIRGEQISAINKLQDAFATFDWDLQQDAKDLYLIFKSFGGVTKIRRSSYAEETDLIDRLIQRFNTAPQAEKLAKFPMLSDWLTTLEESNTAVKEIMAEKAEEFDPNHISATEIRDEIIPVYEVIEKKINASALLEIDPEFNEFIDAINSEIATQNLD